MSRNTFRTLLAVCALALAVSIPAIALAHNDAGRSHSTRQAGDPVGTIASFTDPTLVITSGGQPVSAAVTPGTRIRWAGRGHHRGWFGHASHYRPGFDTTDGPPSGITVPTTTTDGPPTGITVPTTTTDGPPTAINVHFGRPTTADLKAGAAVAGADLALTPTGAVWTDIILVRPAATPAA